MARGGRDPAIGSRFSSEYWSAKRLAREFEAKRQSYERELATYKGETEQYLKKKAAYEQKLKEWKKKYDPYLKTKQGRTVFETTRKLPQRTVQKIYGKYKEEAAKLSQAQQFLAQKQKQLEARRSKLIEKERQLQESAAIYERTAEKAVVIKPTKTETTDGFTVTEAGQKIRTTTSPEGLYPQPREITTYEPTWTRGYVGKAIHSYKVNLHKTFDPFVDKYIKTSEKMAKVESKTAEYMPVERAKEIAMAADIVAMERFEFAQDIYPYAFPGAREVLKEPEVASNIGRLRRVATGAVYTGVREPFLHPFKYGAILTLSAATAGIGGVGTGTANKFITAGSLGFYGGYKASQVKTAYETKGDTGLGEVLGVTIVELGTVAAGYGIAKGVQATASYTQYKVESVKGFGVKKVEGGFQYTAEAKVKPYHPFRIKDRWGETVRVRIESPVKYYTTPEGTTRAASADYFTALVKDQAYKGKFISVTQPYTKGTDLYRSDYISSTKVGERTVDSVGSEISTKAGSAFYESGGKEFRITEYLGAGVSKDVGSSAITGKAGTFTLTEVTTPTDTTGATGVNFIKFASTATKTKAAPVIIPKNVASNIAKTVTAASSKVVTTSSTSTPFISLGTAPTMDLKMETPTIQSTFTIQDQPQRDKTKEKEKSILDTTTKTDSQTKAATKVNISTSQLIDIKQDQGIITMPVQTVSTGQVQEQEQTPITGSRFDFGFATPSLPTPPTGFGLGFPNLDWSFKSKRVTPKKKKKRWGFTRKYKYKPGVFGSTLKPVKGKPKSFQTGLKIRRRFKW